MIGMIKKVILKNKRCTNVARKVKKVFCDIVIYYLMKDRIKRLKKNQPIIFYLGIPAHSNLGDLAQGVCIRRWLHKHYPNFQVVEIETNALVNTHFSLLNKLQRVYRDNDMIVFQSGYTTTDLGGYADEMHRAVMRILPNAKMLMLPQTIFFKNPNNRERTATCYNSINNLLFLARDNVSYEMALDMFPNIQIRLFPDIVTTLIGKYTFNYNRNGILFCCRNDSEKYYSDETIELLMNKCSKFGFVDRTDTTKPGKTSKIVANAETFIMQEIDTYAHYRVIITDRYHGIILSLVAGTPVIILKTTDHKVITGALWFQGIYDNYIYLAESLEDIPTMVNDILNKKLSYTLQSYFEEKYYDKLPVIFEEMYAKKRTIMKNNALK